MKISLPVTVFMSFTMTVMSVAEVHEGVEKGKADAWHPRRLRNAHGSRGTDRVGNPRSGGGVTHFSLGHGKPISQSSGNQDYETHIVGGDESALGEFPYYVDLSICGGSLIAPGVVLSAAHCGEFNGQSVIVGAYNAGDDSTVGAARRTVAETRLHPNYDDSAINNDFSLLRLDTPVAMPTSVRFAINDDSRIPRDNDPLTVLGLGALSEGGGTPNTLRDVVVQAVGTAECNEAYGNVNDETMFCAGVDGGGKDSCQGDSGGPIVERNGNVHTQVGVVSWGTGCARPGVPGVYARISSAQDWIKKVVCDEWKQTASFCDGGGPAPTPTPPGPTPRPTPAPTPRPTPSPTPAPTPAPVNNGPNTCVNLVLELQTDDFGPDTDFFLVNEKEEFIWDEWNLDSNRRYDYVACIDPQGCATLDFFDDFGDGIHSPGYLKITYDGTVVFNTGDIGSGEVFRFGTGC